MARLEPCACGAIDCGECGPAQGYWRCSPHGVMGCDDCAGGSGDEAPADDRIWDEDSDD